MFLPKLGVVLGAMTSTAVAILLLVSPDLLWFIPMWLGWTIAMVAVVAAYIAGHRVHSAVRPSRRMRRWMTEHRTD
jgi:hypothetical protein